MHLRAAALLEILLGRCVVRVGGLDRIDAGLFAGLEPRDRECLEDAYRRAWTAYASGQLHRDDAVRARAAC